MDDPRTEPGPASRPGRLEPEDSVIAAISSGTGQPQRRGAGRSYRLHEHHRRQLLLAASALALGYLLGVLIHARR